MSTPRTTRGSRTVTGGGTPHVPPGAQEPKIGPSSPSGSCNPPARSARPVDDVLRPVSEFYSYLMGEGDAEALLALTAGNQREKEAEARHRAVSRALRSARDRYRLQVGLPLLSKMSDSVRSAADELDYQSTQILAATDLVSRAGGTVTPQDIAAMLQQRAEELRNLARGGYVGPGPAAGGDPA